MTRKKPLTRFHVSLSYYCTDLLPDDQPRQLLARLAARATILNPIEKFMNTTVPSAELALSRGAMSVWSVLGQEVTNIVQQSDLGSPQGLYAIDCLVRPTGSWRAKGAHG